MSALGLPAAAIAAVCYGLASVLQARAARRSAGSEHVDPRLLIRLATQLPYLVGLLLDFAGFALAVVALRSLPLYVVQAITASNLAVSALVVAGFFRVRLAAREWLAIVAICVGLALLGLSAGEEGAQGSELGMRTGLLAGTVVLGALAWWLGRTSRKVPAALLGTVAGLGFGAVALAARMIPSLAPTRLAADPAAWALAIGALIGVLFFATALQRGRVTTVTAMTTVGETVVPAALGIALLGDAIRHGSAPIIVAGFLISLTGTLTLARFGDVPDKMA
jgi:drug/metabolite transporter (DMT)-like permease